MTSVDDRDNDKSFENEQSTVTIPLKEYDKLKEQGKYITDPSLISVIDKLEEYSNIINNKTKSFHIFLVFFLVGSGTLPHHILGEGISLMGKQGTLNKHFDPPKN